MDNPHTANDVEAAPGCIVTFYSYKGGTGRTMSLANTASVLARRLGGDTPPRVLCIDWDFEAPGLHRYFEPYYTDEAKAKFADAPGCLDLIEAMARDQESFKAGDAIGNRVVARNWLQSHGLAKYVLDTAIPGVSIIKAGCFDADYAKRVNQFKWEAFFQATLGLFTGMADYLQSQYDYVLIDSRTGLTDTSGICTMLLPEKLVVAFTPNRQSLEGISDLVRKAVAYRGQSDDWRPLVVFPLPSRIELSRPDLYAAWRRTSPASPVFTGTEGYQDLFEGLFKEIYKLDECNLTEYFDSVALQHVADYAFGEPIAAEREADSSRILLGTAYHAFGERLKELSYPWESLEEARAVQQAEDYFRDIEAAKETAAPVVAVSAAHALLRLDFPEALLERIVQTVCRLAEKISVTSRDAAGALLGELAEELHVNERARGRLAEDLCLQLVQTFREVGEYVAGSKSLGWLWRSGERQFGNCDLVAVLGNLLLDAGLYEPAKKFLTANSRDARNAAESEAPSGPGRLRVAAALARARFECGERILVDEYESLLRQVHSALGERNLLALEVSGELVRTLLETGDNVRAEELQRTALEVCIDLFGPDHTHTQDQRVRLAGVKYLKGEYQDARELLEAALRVQLVKLGEDHPQTLVSTSNLGLVQLETGELDRARKAHETVLAASQRVLGEAHPDTLKEMNNLAAVLREMGQLSEARALQEEELAMCRRVLGPDHPDMIASMSYLATTLMEQKDIASARAVQEQVLTGLRKLYPADSQNVLAAQSNLATMMYRLGDHEGALELEKVVLNSKRKALGDDHPETILAKADLALTFGKTGAAEQQLKLETEVLNSSRKVLGDEHPATLFAMSRLAQTYSSVGDLANARKLLESCASLTERVRGNGHPDTFWCYLELGKLAREQKDLEGASAALRNAVEVAERSDQIDNATATPALLELLEISFEAGNREEAARLKEKIATWSVQGARKRTPQKSQK